MSKHCHDFLQHLQELKDHAKKVGLLLVKHAKKLAQDKTRQEKAKVLMNSNKSQAEAGLQVNSACLNALQATNSKQEDEEAPDRGSGQVSSCLPDVMAITDVQVVLSSLTLRSPLSELM